jgi:Uma2 family endonuclease
MSLRTADAVVNQAPRTISQTHPTTNGAAGQPLPRLENGDRLSRAEFERRYAADPTITKAELIEGVVYVASPVRVWRHAAPHSRIIIWLGLYQASTPDVNLADNATLRLDLDNEPQPDVALWLDGGNAFVDDDDYLQGAPELLVEVAASSAALDLHHKLQAYRRNGVQEYLVLLTQEQEVRWHTFADGETALIQPDARGVLCSRVLPGLHLSPDHFWRADLAGLLAVLQQGLATEEHASFVQQRQRISANNIIH